MLSDIAKTWLHEEPGFFILDKPPGIGMHDENDSPGLVTLVRQHLDDANIFPCHRLDKGTSGLLILGKGQDNTRDLSQLFATKDVQKFYLAISAAKPRKKQGSVVGDMLQARRGAWKLAQTTKNPAVSQFFSFGLGGLRGFIVKPATGKTHQIRVALKSVAAPILGDERYGGVAPGMLEKYRSFVANKLSRSCLSGEGQLPEGEEDLSPPLAIDRMYLHAFSIAFTLRGERFEFVRAPSVGRIFTSAEFTQQLDEATKPGLMALPWPNVDRYLA